MAENSSSQERTEQATPKRRSEAKKKGEVLRSRELNVFVSLLAASIALMVLGKQIMLDLQNFLKNALSLDQTAVADELFILESSYAAVLNATLILLPFFVLMLLSMLLSPLMLGGWTFNLGLLNPKYERIDPWKGFGRIFSIRGLLELLKALGKFLLVAAAVITVLVIIFDDILNLASQSLAESLNLAGNLFIWCFLGFSSVLIVVVAMDVPFQIYSFNKKLKMTKQEIKDEMKETDGRPEVKSAIRDKQQQFAQQRMMSEVPRADVVVTNPTHFAVALQFDDSKHQAPVVIAKGRNLVAARIREIAEDNQITVFSAPPLARALYISTEINQEIPHNLFQAVAQVLAYVFQLRDYRPGNERPIHPQRLPVPEEYEQYFKKGFA